MVYLKNKYEFVINTWNIRKKQVSTYNIEAKLYIDICLSGCLM